MIPLFRPLQYLKYLGPHAKVDNCHVTFIGTACLCTVLGVWGSMLLLNLCTAAHLPVRARRAGTRNDTLGQTLAIAK